MRRYHPVRTAGIVGGFLGLVALSYAFAAANTMPGGDAKLGEGVQVISGFTISNITYTLNGANPRNVDAVNFTANPVPAATATLKIRLVAAGAVWYTCTDPAALDGNIVCDTTVGTQATVSPSNELTIIIAQ
jgi:hypothetical protein